MKEYKSYFIVEAVQRPTNYISQIEHKLDSKKEEIKKYIDKKDIGKLCSLLSSYLSAYKIKVRYEDTLSQYPGISLEHGILPDKYNTIIVNINSNALNIKKEKSLGYFIDGLLQVIGHELIHRLQYHDKVTMEIQKDLALKRKNKDHKQYKLQKDEIMAYAWNIVEEFRFMDLDNDEILNAINDKKKKYKFMAYIPRLYSEYLIMFDELDNIEERNLLHKYMYLYIKGEDETI